MEVIKNQFENKMFNLKWNFEANLQNIRIEHEKEKAALTSLYESGNYQKGKIENIQCWGYINL